jgi:hypothetical protein
VDGERGVMRVTLGKEPGAKAARPDL